MAGQKRVINQIHQAEDNSDSLLVVGTNNPSFLDGLTVPKSVEFVEVPSSVRVSIRWGV